MSKWSENYKYKNPDINDIANNVSRIMGIDSGAAGRRSSTMSDILTGAKTEAQIAKNVKLNAIAEIAKKIMGTEDYSTDQKYGRLISTGGGDYGQYLKREALLEAEKKEQLAKALTQENIAKQEGQKAGIGGLREGLAKQIAAMGLPVNIKDYDRSNPNEMQLYSNALDQQQLDSETLEALAQRFGILGDKPHTTTTDVTGSRGERETVTKEKKAEATISYTKARQLAVEKYSEKQVKLAEDKANKVISDMNINLDIGHERINNLRQVGLNGALIAQEKMLNLKETNALIKERIKEAGFKTSIAEKEDDAKGGELYYKKRQQEEKLEKLKSAARKEKNLEKKAKINAEIAEKTKEYEITLKKMKASKATTEDTTATVKLNQLKEKYETDKKILEQKLAKAKDDASRSKILNEIEEKTKEFKIRKAELEANKLSTQIFKRMVDTSSPSQIQKEDELKQSQIDAKNRTGTSGVDNVGDFIDKKLGKGDTTTSTTTTSTTTASTPKKGLPVNPVVKSIFDRLMTTVEPEVLKSWTPEEVDKAVAMIQEKHPNMDEARIRRLIQTAQRRSQ